MLEKEQIFVAKTFKEHFKGDDKSPLVLYGIGRNTEAILQCCSNLNIKGLMDQDSVGQFKIGKKVLSYEEIIELRPKIVIVARDSVVNIIYNRIAFLEEKGIKVYKIDGTKLCKDGLKYDNEELPYWSVSEKALEKAIDQHKVISFDIFDTLIMRRLIKHDRLSFEDEKKYLVKRDIMIEMLNYAMRQGKKIFLVSDMYYSSKELRELLEHCGIMEKYEIIVSCEHDVTKEDGGLFKILKLKVRKQLGQEAEESILHIGDNRIADGEMAESAGINTFLIMSSYELLMASSMQSILVKPGGLRWNQNVGYFISSFFNNPFALSGQNGYVKAGNLQELGYFFIAPLIYEYMLWLINQILQDDIEQMLFASRDGWLPYLIYEKMKQKNTNLPNAIYFKTSRRSVTVAAIRDRADINRLTKRKFSGSIKNFFQERFGILAKEDGIWENTETQTNKLLDQYERLILENAAIERASYLNYLRAKGINDKSKQGLFDFVAGGTVQYHLEKLIEQKVQGYYFATMNLPNDFYEEGCISAPFGNITSYGLDTKLSKHYLVMESILTDQDNTFVKIDTNNKLVFAEGENKKYQQMKKIHQGILRYVEDRLELDNVFTNEKNFEWDFSGPDGLFGYVFEEKNAISDQLKAEFENDDLYDGQQVYNSF
ncbi:HAD-IA family hydrolase [Aminipila sp.]|uniref:HAD-IA family hydrolase n=1 Tax=Aminipila sp. TaxID=2060095 RepID=UPI00289B2010|nr:HAD-IA family hydrolase [Aminipila sp.]